MSVSGRNAPSSPVSVGGSEWPGPKYPPDDGSLPNGRGNLASPPLSSGSNSIGVMSMNGFPSGPRSNGGGPSPPASVGRSSMGTGSYARSESGRNSTRAEAMDETILQDHYYALKLFLQGRDPNGKQPPNKARDKLLRLSSVQFYELSTDVYDELIRRQATARAPPNAPNGPPTFLLPEKNFHPKRNQARQRLSSLGPPRFRDLATDVFFELERRFPRFVGAEIPRGVSSISMRPPGRTGTPSNGYGPRPPRMRQPSDAGSMRGPPPLEPYGVPPSPGLPNGGFKALNQPNTIVPNKSTMVEEDDDGDSYGPDRKSKGSSEADKKLIEGYQNQLRELREKMEGMEDAMKKKDEESHAKERKEWDDVRNDLESKLNEAQSLNESMKQELERVREDHDEETRHLRGELMAIQQSGDMRNADDKLQQENQELRESLMEQRRVTDEVRKEAQGFLMEMRSLSQQSTSTYEKQLELEESVEQLEAEVKQWKGLYARTKTQLRNMRASSIGLAIDQGAGKMVRDGGFTDDSGIIKDVHITRFQIAVDDLLQKARSESPDMVIDSMKSVVVSVRRITKDLDESTSQDEAFAQQKPKLKAMVSSTANNLITTSKNFAAGNGLSPVSLLDAAASHLTAAVVNLAKAAKIRPTPDEQLEEDDDDDGSVTPVESTGFFSPPSTTQVPSTQETLPPPPPFNGLGGMRASAGSSAYSPVSSPRESVEPHSRPGTNGMSYMSKGAPNGYGMHPHDGQDHDSRVDDYYY